MNAIRPIVAVLLALLVIAIRPGPSAAKEKHPDLSGITVHQPQSRTSEIKTRPAEKGGKTWLWILIGAAVAAGGIAAIAGGGGSDGGGDDGGSSGTSGGDTGSVDISW